MAPIARRRRLSLTVRFRLTLLYSVLFVASSALLLAITYGIVNRIKQPVTVELPDGGTLSGQAIDAPDGSLPADHGELRTETPTAPNEVAPPQNAPTDEELRRIAEQQHDAQMHEFLVQSLIALGIMAVVSVAVGWLAAGRALRNVRTITTAARDISANNLHERLDLDGPDDELKELAETFDAVLDRLEAAFSAQQRFVANASHELRTPLARQRTLLQVALADPDASIDALRAVCQRVLAAGDEQARLIDALLTLARGQAGVDRHEDFDLATVADNVVLRCEAEARTRHLAVRSTLASAPASGDRRLVDRLVANLVDNAIRHNINGDSAAGGWIEVTTAAQSGRAVVTVANSGPPVPADDIDELFVPFHRLGTERTGNRDGLGLGLSIVKAIADAHRATVTITPSAEGGLRIEVVFAKRAAEAKTFTESSPHSRTLI